MQPTWLSVIPPLIVIALATITQRLLFSLVIGLISAALVVNNFSIPTAGSFLFMRLKDTTELANLTSWQSFNQCYSLFIVAFLLLLGLLITMIRHSGAAYAYGAFVMRNIKTAAGAQRASLLLSSLFFIDDYFSCLTVGSVMQPITDQFKISRVKLGVLVNGIAAPLAVLVPLSSWVAYIVGQLRNAGVADNIDTATLIIADPFALYMATIPTMFYALLMVIALWYLACSQRTYGIIAQHEQIAIAQGNLFGGKVSVVRRGSDVSPARKSSSALIDFIMPLGLLFTLVIAIMAYSGGWWLCGGQRTFLGVLQHANSAAALFWSGLCTCIATGLFFLARGKLTLKEMPSILREGYGLMGGSVIMLILIWTLSTILTKDLATGSYLATLLDGTMSPSLFPAVMFVFAMLVAIMMGSAWGAIGMLIPLALSLLPNLAGLPVPVDVAQLPLVMPTLGAIVTGAMVSNHMSPIADIMLMTATSAGVYHLDLVKAQLSVAVPVVMASAVSFLSMGFMLNAHSFMISIVVSIGTGLLSLVSMLYGLQRIASMRRGT